MRFRKEEEILNGEVQMRSLPGVGAKDNPKILTSCPACLQGLCRFGEDLQNGLLQADYIVVEMARQVLGEQWMTDYVALANAGGLSGFWCEGGKVNIRQAQTESTEWFQVSSLQSWVVGATEQSLVQCKTVWLDQKWHAPATQIHPYCLPH